MNMNKCISKYVWGKLIYLISILESKYPRKWARDRCISKDQSNAILIAKKNE